VAGGRLIAHRSDKRFTRLRPWSGSRDGFDLRSQSEPESDEPKVQIMARSRKTKIAVASSLSCVLFTATAYAQSPPGDAVPVTVDNFARAESDRYLSDLAQDAGGLGKIAHHRETASIDHQTVIRLNRDTLYSFAVFDLDAGPVTITMPDAGKRFMSMQVINEDHYVPGVYYGPGTHVLTRQNVGTRYAVVGVRTLVDPNDANDLAEVHKLQDAIKVSQQNTGKLELPNWDRAGLKEVREALLVLAEHTDGFSHAFGTKDTVDPVRHLIGTAAGWGGNPDRDATYVGAAVPNNDGKSVYQVRVKDVPVDAFWSISVYNAEGYFEKNPYGAYSLNNITAKTDPDGAVTIKFGGCDGKIPNCLSTMPGWNYLVRFYRPRAEILNGKWKFPEPQVVK
jgi:hypothetical protein